MIHLEDEPLENNQSTSVINEESTDDSSPETEPVSGIDLSPDESLPTQEDSATLTDSDLMTLTSQVASLSEQVGSLQVQVDERTGQYVRIVADFENFRRRTQREKEDLEQQVKGSTLTELLSVVDNFERARSQIKPQTEGEMVIHKSYQGVYKQLVDGLKRLGDAPMRAEGQEFDPNLHEAVMREQSADYGEGIVMEELVRGYLLGDRVLRHAMVKVAVTPEPPTEENNTEEESVT